MPQNSNASNQARSGAKSGPKNEVQSEMKNSKIHLPAQAYPPLQLPLGYDEICKILPHRYPFLLVDRITELEPGRRCVGIKCVTLNEEFFQGHFPGRPVMPGVLILEAMAQVAGVLTLVSRNTPGALSYFAAIEKARFRQPVQPGDQLVTEATLQVLRGALCKVSVVGRVDGQDMVEAEYTFMTADGNSVGAVARATGIVSGGADTTSSASPSPIAAPLPNANGKPGSNGTSTPASVPDGIQTSGNPSQRAALIEPPRDDVTETFIHPTAMIDSQAQLEDPVWIGPYCVLEAKTSVGAGTILEANVIVKSGTTIGKRCRVWPNVVLGHEPQDSKYKGEESFVRIGDDNVLREMVTVHRATGEGQATVIGNKNLLMAYAHVGHNCVIGDSNMISNSSGVAGHVTIEDRTVIGGFVGVHQFVHIGSMAMVGGLSKVVQDVPPFCIADGRPAKIHGLNIRGLRRNGVAQEQRNQVSAAFKLLYRSGLNTTQAMEKIRATIPPSDTLNQMLDFIERVGGGRLGRQDETAHL
jgi:UDP-N-acetylglucosamine acyltransferase